MSVTNLLADAQAFKWHRKVATVALVGIAYFLIADLALYFLNPGYELIWASAGDYDVGPYGFLAASAFFALGFGSLALSIGLYRGTYQPRRSLIGLFFLVIWGTGMLVAAIFPANNGGSTVPHMTTVYLAGLFPVEVMAIPDTSFGWIHLLAMLWSFFSLTLAAIFLSQRFKRDENWRPFHRLAMILALVMLTVSLLLFRWFLSPSHTGFLYFNVRIFIIAGLSTGLLWLLLIAARLRFVIIGSVSK